jgi:hypothetical protein
LTLQAIYHQPLRATEGFLTGLLQIMGAGVKSPDYSTLSYRAKELEIETSQAVKEALNQGKSLHIAVDSTGVKIFGEGEWKVRMHGWSKHRRWRKIHLGVEIGNHLIVAGEISGNEKGDAQMLSTLLEQLPKDRSLKSLRADSAYDTKSTYELLEKKKTSVIIPPRKNARVWQHGNKQKDSLARDRNLRRIRSIGRKKWKEEVGYHKRSLSETAMFRLKTIFGPLLSSRKFDTQRTQTKIRIHALNLITLLGMPTSIPI